MYYSIDIIYNYVKLYNYNYIYDGMHMRLVKTQKSAADLGFGGGGGGGGAQVRAWQGVGTEPPRGGCGKGAPLPPS